ncbi:uncharacterized protein LOC118436670 [Folsomia candida]|uniref:F-box domain-containing protein n=1 Tax=Folsomia candida TaxID=158441 RepID=A0A226DVG3_FOLCA|nr:uncharacterized protein LOC118436670 [Folsomia candida]OXA49475.1 hypothetical protein Fcan01_15487 [Folsomia candida]
MENSTRTSHLISSFPEVIFKIMEFLPISDLESAALVYSTWEKEALRHLLARNPVDVHLHNVNDSMDLLPLRKLSPKRINLIVCVPEENAEILLSKIELFTAMNFNTVTRLGIEIPIARHVASRLVKIYESFKNLKSLEFHPILSDCKALFSSALNWADLLPANLEVPQKLTTLTINMSKLYPDEQAGRWANVVSLNTRFLTVFSHVKKLKLVDKQIYAHSSDLEPTSEEHVPTT